MIVLYALLTNLLFAKDVTQFGIDNKQSMIFENGEVEKNIDKLSLKENFDFKNADWPTPLSYNGILYFGTKDGFFNAYDFIKNQFIWKINLETYRVHGTPILDSNSKKIYFPSTLWQKETNGKYPFTIHFKINSVDLDGKNLKSYKIDHDQYLKPNSKTISSNQAIHCKNSLGILNNKDGKFLFWGCSMFTDPTKGINFRQGKGIRAPMYFVPINHQGELLTNKIKLFTPAKVTDNPLSGYDSGIWNTGSKSLALKDGSILITTGNGPFIPSESNYGCSILKLNTNNFKVTNYISADVNQFRECEFNGLDFSSSSINLNNVENQDIAFTVNKGGFFWAFNPYNFNNNNIILKYKFANHAYGIPLSIKDKNKIVTFVTGYDYHSNHPPIELIAPESAEQFLKNYKKSKCIGYFSSEKPQKISLYYSGPGQDDYVISSAKNETLKFDVRSYINTNFSKTINPILQSEFKSLNLIEKKLSLYSYSSNDLPGEKIGITMTSKDFFNPNLKYDLFNLKDSVSLYQNPARDCSSQNTNLEKAYIFTQSLENQAIHELNILGFEFQSKKKNHRLYSHNIPNLRPHNSNSILINGNKKIVLMTAYNPDSKESDSLALFIDIKTGEVIKKIPFKGIPKFAMPIIIANTILIPTNDNGLIQFKIDNK